MSHRVGWWGKKKEGGGGGKILIREAIIVSERLSKLHVGIRSSVCQNQRQC